MALSAAIVHCTRRFQRRNADLRRREGACVEDWPAVACGVFLLVDMDIARTVCWLLPSIAGQVHGMQPESTSMVCMFLCAGRRLLKRGCHGTHRSGKPQSPVSSYEWRSPQKAQGPAHVAILPWRKERDYRKHSHFTSILLIGFEQSLRSPEQGLPVVTLLF